MALTPSKHRNGIPVLELLQDGIILTQTGLETQMLSKTGFDLPHFSSFQYFRDPKGFHFFYEDWLSHLRLAEQYGATGIILSTPTWRASPYWSSKLGMSIEEVPNK